MFCMSELLISVNLPCFYQLHTVAVTVTAHLYIRIVQVHYCVTKKRRKLSATVNIKNIITSLFCITLELYTGCSRRNVPNFGRVFLMLNYTDITQNTYIQSYGDNGHQNVWASGVSTYCMPSVTSYSSNARPPQPDMVMQWPWWVRYRQLVNCEVQT